MIPAALSLLRWLLLVLPFFFFLTLSCAHVETLLSIYATSERWGHVKPICPFPTTALLSHSAQARLKGGRSDVNLKSAESVRRQEWNQRGFAVSRPVGLRRDVKGRGVYWWMTPALSGSGGDSVCLRVSLGRLMCRKAWAHRVHASVHTTMQAFTHLQGCRRTN